MEEHHEEKHDEEHGSHQEEGKKSGIGASFQKHKTLWIVGGVGAAGVLLLLFMNSGGGSSTASTSAQPSSTTDQSTVGAGGAVDTSNLVGSSGPSWYNPGSAENLDYWPYVPNSSGSSSGSSSSKSKSSGSSSSTKKSKSSSGGVSHGSSHGVTSGTKTSTSKNKAKKSSSSVQPSTKGAAHGHVIAASGNTNIAALQQKYFPGSNTSNAQGNIMQYGNNSKLLKQYAKTGQYNPKTGAIKAGTKLVV